MSHRYGVGSTADIAPGVIHSANIAAGTIATDRLAAAADASHDGYLKQGDWSTFAAKLGGSPGNSHLLRTDGSGNVAAATIGTGLSFDGTTLAATAAGEAVGTMKAWPGVPSTFPGIGTWFSMDGSAVSRTTYATLWAIAQANFAANATYAPFGPGNGSTTFNLPDSRDRVLLGAGSTYTLGQTGGGTTDTTGASNTGTNSNAGVNNATGAAGSSPGINDLTAVVNGTPGTGQGTINVEGPAHQHAYQVNSHTHSTPSLVIDIVQPYLAISHIIRAL